MIDLIFSLLALFTTESPAHCKQTGSGVCGS
jgi:hypothetical protein